MKLRSRTKVPTSNSPSVTATLPIPPLSITRLQTPPVSELSNAGSTVARKERLSELSSSIMDISDTEDTIYSVTPTKSRSRPTITVPAAPLTTKNLALHQEEITSAVENVFEEGPSSSPPTPNARLTQAKNYLLTEDINSDPEFKTRYLQIAEYLHYHRRGKGREEVLQLLKHHDPQAAASTMPLPAENDPGPQKQADPFEWTNKLDDLTERVKQSPSGSKEAFAIANLQELARPLNRGRLPSPVQAYRLIDEQMAKEFHEDDVLSDADREELWAFERDLSSASLSSDSQPPEEARTPAFRLGEGKLMPQEMMDVDWDRDRSKLEESLVGYGDGDRGEAQLLVAETPLLQALMSEQIESDLAARVKKGQTTKPVARRPAMLMTQKFALPRPAQSKIDEAAEIAKSLNIPPDPPTPSPRTALFLKRKFDQQSDSETEEEEEEEEDGDDRRPEPPGGRAVGGVQGEHVYVGETIPSVGLAGGHPEMSGALQDP